jgi:hypothetical protein
LQSCAAFPLHYLIALAGSPHPNALAGSNLEKNNNIMKFVCVIHVSIACILLHLFFTPLLEAEPEKMDNEESAEVCPNFENGDSKNQCFFNRFGLLIREKYMQK